MTKLLQDFIGPRKQTAREREAHMTMAERHSQHYGENRKYKPKPSTTFIHLANGDILMQNPVFHFIIRSKLNPAFGAVYDYVDGCSEYIETDEYICQDKDYYLDLVKNDKKRRVNNGLDDRRIWNDNH